MVDPLRLRVRLLRFGDYSLDLEIFFYLRTNGYDEYWAMREDMNLWIMDIVKDSGSSFAFPSSTAYLVSGQKYYPIEITEKNQEEVGENSGEIRHTFNSSD